MHYNWIISILSNDGVWMRQSFNEVFVPQLGMTLVGYTGKTAFKVSAVAWDRVKAVFFLTGAWMVIDIPDSKELKEMGWKVYKKEEDE